MLYTFPDYYNEFACVGGSCPDTCCACWQIVIDDASLRKYVKCHGKFKKQILKNVNFFNKTFRQHDDLRCRFLNDKNLCDIQLAMGEGALCRTCRNYPRHIEEFENVREISLSVSCPKAAEILLNKSTKAEFVEIERDGEETFEDFDLLMYSKLCDARTILIEILQNRILTIDVRMQLAIAFGHDLQRKVNLAEIFSFEEVFSKYKSDRIISLAQKKDKEFNKNLTLKYNTALELYDILFKLEHLKADWKEYLNDTFDILYKNGENEYDSLDGEFRKWYADNQFSLEIQMEQLLVYFIFTYFCGSVYDDKIYSKVFMSVISVFLIKEMIKAKWIKENKKIDTADVIRIVYRYSRELEHSDINLELFEKMAKPFKN